MTFSSRCGWQGIFFWLGGEDGPIQNKHLEPFRILTCYYWNPVHREKDPRFSPSLPPIPTEQEDQVGKNCSKLGDNNYNQGWLPTTCLEMWAWSSKQNIHWKECTWEFWIFWAMPVVWTCGSQSHHDPDDFQPPRQFFRRFDGREEVFFMASQPTPQPQPNLNPPRNNGLIRPYSVGGGGYVD